MAVEQALATASASKFLWFSRNSCSSTSTRSPNFSYSLKSRTKQLRLARCSLDFNQNGYNQTVYPKPIEVPWKKELCNSVQLIGNVGVPVEIRQLPSGSVVAWTRLAVQKSPTEATWINLSFWNELAHVAHEHVQKGHQIFVSGRLVTDTVESGDGKLQTYYKVVAQQLNFVARTISPISLYDHDDDDMTEGRNPSNGAADKQQAVEELWQVFFANPEEWWDNRMNKRNPNYPDFKHKETGEALWIEGRYSPPWVKSQLEIMDAMMGSVEDGEGSMTRDAQQF